MKRQPTRKAPDIDDAIHHVTRARVAAWLLGQMLSGDLSGHLDDDDGVGDYLLHECQEIIDDATEHASRALGHQPLTPASGWPALKSSARKTP